MIFNITIKLLEKLVLEGSLQLVPEANVDVLATEIVKQMPSAGFGSHFGSWLANTLIDHPMVEELFATNEELTEMLSYINH